MDPHVTLLRQLFLTHPAWLSAADHIKDGCSSAVRFSHVPGDYQLLRHDGKSDLLEGKASDPDLAFLFTPKSIERLANVKGTDIADFGVELLELANSADPELHVRIRVIAGFSKLLFRGYVGMLMKAGPRVLAYGGKGTSFTEVKKLITQLRAKGDPWDE